MTIRFSEAQFRTFKYRPEFPDRFGSIEDARAISPRPLRVVQRRPIITAACGT